MFDFFQPLHSQGNRCVSGWKNVLKHSYLSSIHFGNPDFSDGDTLTCHG